MKILAALKPEKYNAKYAVTLRTELENEEDTQYPLEDLLDRYLVNCSSMEEKEATGKRLFTFTIEGDNKETINTIAGLVGKRVFNYEDGDCVKLCIE